MGAKLARRESWREQVSELTSFTALRERLLEAAIDRVGASDFGASDYETGFDVLLASLDANPAASLCRADAIGELIVMALAGRLHAQAGWKARPDVLTRPISAPLMIAGIPRSGTTALHRLLSMDPQFQGLERWLARTPMIRPPRQEWDSQPAFLAALDEAAARDNNAPDAQKAHRIAAGEVDECLIAMSQSFMSNWFGSQMDVPDYDAWFLAQDETASYRRYGDILRLIGAQDDRPWLLKNPSHILGIEGLLAAFPDALVIQTHRHPSETIASLGNLLANILGAKEPEDRARIARRNLDIYRIATERMSALQDRQPDRVLNIDFREFLARPMDVVRSIYHRFDLELGSEAEANMLAWVADNPQDKHGAHTYTLKAGGLERDEVREAFAPYIERFGLEDAL